MQREKYPSALTIFGKVRTPSQEEMERCGWAMLSFAKCSKEVKCADCPYHPQNKHKGRISAPSTNKKSDD